MKRRFFPILIGLIVLFSLLPTIASAAFSDVPRDHWAYDAVDYLEGEGFIVGYPDGTYQGDRMLTRYEFAIVTSRIYDQFLDLIDANEPPTVEIEAILDMLMEEFQPEIDELRELVGANTERIEALEGTVEGFESMIDDVHGRVDDMEARFHPYGDLAVRFHGYYPEGQLQSQRARFQLRFGFLSQVSDEFSFGARFTSGTGSSCQSAFRTFDDAFGFDPLNIDLAYMMWRPDYYPGFTMWGGKFSPPWKTTVVSYDGDVTVEGLAQHYTHDKFNFYLGELVPTDKGFYLLAQVGYDFTEDIDAALTYHYINDDAWEFISRDMMNGALKSMWNFDLLEPMSDYRALEATVDMSGDLGDLPVRLQGTYYLNLADDSPMMPELEVGNADGYQQAYWGRLTFLDAPSEQGDWNVFAEYGYVEPNSVLSWQTDACRGYGDAEFYDVGWNYRLLRNTQLLLLYLKADRIASDNSFEHFLVNITTWFK